MDNASTFLLSMGMIRHDLYQLLYELKILWRLILSCFKHFTRYRERFRWAEVLTEKTLLFPKLAEICYVSEIRAPPQDEENSTCLDLLCDTCCPHWPALHELQGDQELTWQSRTGHRRRRRRRQASLRWTKISKATKITRTVILTETISTRE